MSELIPLGIRLDKKMVEELNQIADEEHLDRTAIIRKLIASAIENYKKDMVMRKYEQGKISISKAAEDTGLTVGEIEEYMVRKGYRSKYSTGDLERELELLKV
ncbi:MAG: ribbon-helix-helix protein, CopG family [Candidatus Methanoperedens sp.]|nr:ribbon-helix-helix protein, CopG family [Candidatus Methanoperedens sp.]